MTTVFAIHGVARKVDRQRLEFHGVSRLRALKRFLSSVPRFLLLSEALAGRGDALTVDDATHGSAQAALLARKYGHNVTLFVNPEHVESGAPYSFLLLSSLVDRLDRRTYEFDDVSFTTSTVDERFALRRSIKATLCTIKREAERLAYVMDLGKRWKLGSLEVPEHYRTLRKGDLLMLRDKGVDLQNHGWSHSPHGILTPDESAREVRDGREWLLREIGTDAPYFAVPFGDVMPNPPALSACETWLTAHFDLPQGSIAPQVFNRLTPEFSMETARSRSLRAREGRLIYRWSRRLRALFH